MLGRWSFHKNLIRVGSPVVRALRDFCNFRNEKLKKQGTRLSILVFLLFYRDGWEKLDVFERLVVSTYIHIYIYVHEVNCTFELRETTWSMKLISGSIETRHEGKPR